MHFEYIPTCPHCGGDRHLIICPVLWRAIMATLANLDIEPPLAQAEKPVEVNE